MNEWKVVDQDTGDVWYKDSRKEAEEAVKEFGDVKDLEIESPEGEEAAHVTEDDVVVQQGGKTDGGKEKIAETQSMPVEDDMSLADTPGEQEEPSEGLEQLGESLGTDPLSILPSHMIDTIQGKPAINKRGYAMIAERYGVSVKSEIETYPWENDDGRCVAKAVATTEDGKEYQDYASAAESDGDMSDQLVELASTRALKRVTGWATGLGIVSYQELSSELEEEL